MPCSLGDDNRSGRVDHTARGELESDRGSPEQLGIQRQSRGVDSLMQGVESSRCHRQVQAEQGDRDHGCDDPPPTHASSPLRRLRVKEGRTANLPKACPRRSSRTVSPSTRTRS